MKKLITSFLVVALSGCGANVDCNDSDFKEIALQIIQDRMEKAVWYREMKVALSSPSLVDIQTTSKNDEIKQSACRANYTFDYNGSQRSVPIEYSLSYLQDSGKTQVSLDPDGISSALMGILMVEQPKIK